jgi:BirA family biotin operon repressor/biotin-[acetyl-CoA-carboxylase] ligase
MLSLHLLDVVDSTNRWLLDQPDQTYSLVIARRQTAGVGRLGRTWESPPGGLYMSLAWTYFNAMTAPGALSLSVAVGLAELIASLGTADVQVKWPNDLVDSSGRKLGGILGAFEPRSRGCRVVMGVGINVKAASVGMLEAGRTPAGLEDIGVSDIDEQLVGRLANTMISACATFDGHLCDDFDARWAERDWLYRRMVRVDTPAGMLEGRAMGLDATGALLVRSHGETTAIRGGEVRVYSEQV